ncbi:hypothetical protein FJY94_05940, partial [Candidatus Kaiserbacteria bacterium]|nr:hypothetical protein [Candidatus Kaiserbacteria bacterium]
MGLRDTANEWIARLRQGTQVRMADLDDVECLSSECVFEQDADGNPLDALSYLVFEVVERPAGGPTWRGFRVIKVSELKYLPQEARADASLIRKQAALIRGLYASGVEMITLHYGIFDPPLGIVQCYGAAARHETKEIAIQLAEGAHAAVIASLTAQYPQSRFAPLTIRRGRWLWEALKNMQRVTTLIGQPDPRESARGGGQDAGMRPATSEYSEQQNEILFRALARAREEFLFLNIATPIARRNIAAMLESLANLTSPIASRQQGATSIGFGVSLPIILNVGQAQSANESYGTSESHGVSQGVGVSHGRAHTEGIAESSGWSHTTGVTQTEGQAETNSVMHSSGVTHSSGVSHGTSESFGAAQTQSESHTSGIAHTDGTFASSSSGGSHVESQGGSHTETDPAGMGSVSLSLAPADLGLKFGYSDNITGPTISDSSSWGVSDGSSWASTSGVSSATTVSEATTVGQAATQSHSVGVSDVASELVSHSESTSVGQAVTHSQAVSNSEAYSVSGSRTASHSETVSEG